MCDNNGNFKMVDADTIDFIYRKKHYKGLAYFPPSLQIGTYQYFIKAGDDYITNSVRIFTEKSDDFSFAFTIFNLLCGVSPYAAVPSAPDEFERRQQNICPIFKSHPNYDIPLFTVKRKYIGRSLYKLFARTFLLHEHITAKEFLRVLKKRRLRYQFKLLPVRRYDGKTY